ncbi:hypothetical protein LINGRAHAP2_LOCUS21656, partial [Linum grandiflorum]
ECEAEALLLAAQWYVEEDYEDIHFETDSQVVAAQALQARHPDLSEFGVLIDLCRSALALIQFFTVSFARRCRNVVGPKLAQQSLTSYR